MSVNEKFQVESGKLIEVVSGVIANFTPEVASKEMWKENKADAKWKEVGDAKTNTITEV